LHRRHTILCLPRLIQQIHRDDPTSLLWTQVHAPATFVDPFYSSNRPLYQHKAVVLAETTKTFVDSGGVPGNLEQDTEAVGEVPKLRAHHQAPELAPSSPSSLSSTPTPLIDSSYLSETRITCINLQFLLIYIHVSQLTPNTKSLQSQSAAIPGPSVTPPSITSHQASFPDTFLLSFSTPPATPTTRISKSVLPPLMPSIKHRLCPPPSPFLPIQV